MSLTDKAITQIRALIASGALPPGAKLPPEPELAAQLGLSRNLAREAVKALAVARVLEIRRGDGTYVTSLQPSLLFEGLGGAVELLQGDPTAVLDLMEVRRLLEPAATALAVARLSDDGLAEVKRHGRQVATASGLRTRRLEWAASGIGGRVPVRRRAIQGNRPAD